MNINARSRSKHSVTVILYAVLMAVIIIGIITAWIIVSGRNRIAIDEVYGNVIVERSSGQISAKQGMRLESGDCVKVLSGGSARITLGRDRYIYPEADSAVTVTRSKEDKSFGAELLTGAAAVRLDKAADIKVSALNVIVTASGSVFRVSCTDNAAEIICADGEADISGGGTAQKLAAGSLARLTSVKRRNSAHAGRGGGFRSSRKRSEKPYAYRFTAQHDILSQQPWRCISGA